MEKGERTKKIPHHEETSRAVFLLLSLYFSDLKFHRLGSSFYSPSLNNEGIPILWYADEMVILLRSIIGLRKMLKFLSNCCQEEKLSINCNKTEVLIFHSIQHTLSLENRWKVNQTGLPMRILFYSHIS